MFFRSKFSDFHQKHIEHEESVSRFSQSVKNMVKNCTAEIIQKVMVLLQQKNCVPKMLCELCYNSGKLEKL